MPRGKTNRQTPAQRRQSRRPTRASAGAVGATDPSSVVNIIPPFNRSSSRITIPMWDASPRGLIGNDTTSTNYAFKFQIADVVNSTLAARFDAYRILYVDCIYKPNSTAGTAGLNSTWGSACWVAYDPDDNDLVGVSTTASNATAQLHSLLEPWQLRIYPRPSIAAFQAGAFTAYTIPTDAPWVDSDNPTCLHYGLKVGIPRTATTISGAIYFRYMVELTQPE